MAYTDDNGIVFVEDTDNISPLNALLNTMQAGTSRAVGGLSSSIRVQSVANQSQRNALIGSDTVYPVLVYREDTKAFEVAVAGNIWHSWSYGPTTDWVSLGTAAGWQMNNGYVVRGGHGLAQFDMRRTGNNLGGNNLAFGPIPASLRPSRTMYGTATVQGSHRIYPIELTVEGRFLLPGVALSTGQRVRGQVSWEVIA